MHIERIKNLKREFERDHVEFSVGDLFLNSDGHRLKVVDFAYRFEEMEAIYWLESDSRAGELGPYDEAYLRRLERPESDPDYSGPREYSEGI